MIITKQKIRQVVENNFSNLSLYILKQKNDRICKKLLSLISNIKLTSEFIIGGFAPIDGKNEVDWFSSFKSFYGRIAFPSEKDNSQMGFFLCDPDRLEKRKEFGTCLLVPPKFSSLITPDILLIPGLAFSPKGFRLGRGGGYYDRYLLDYKGKKIGICFHEQFIDDVPIEEHDQLMDFIVTDEAIIEI